MCHIALVTDYDKDKIEWLEPGSDNKYKKL